MDNNESRMYQNDSNALMSNYNSASAVQRKPINIKLLIIVVITILAVVLAVVFVSLFSNRVNKYSYVSFSGNIAEDNDIIQEIISTEGDSKSSVSLFFDNNKCELDIITEGHSIIDYCSMSDDVITFYHRGSEISFTFETVDGEFHLFFGDSFAAFKSS